MAGVVWSKFYWSDWSDDPALKLCSLAAQGLWMRMLCIAAEADPYGHVAVNGKALGPAEIADLAGKPVREVAPLIEELVSRGVAKRFRGRLISKRMVKDARKAAEAKANGSKGGNPSLRKDKGNSPPDNPQDKPGHKRRLKTQEPRARSKVEAPHGASNLTLRSNADERAGGSSSRRAWVGPAEVRQAFVIWSGEAWTRTYIDPAGWQDVPDRALIPATNTAGRKIVEDAKAVLDKLNILVLEKAA